MLDHVDTELETKAVWTLWANADGLLEALKVPVTSAYFKWRPANVVYDSLVKHYELYKVAPTGTEILEVVRSSSLGPEDKKTVMVFLETLKNTSFNMSTPFILDELKEYHKKSLLIRALERSTSLLQNGKVDDAVSSLSTSASFITKSFSVVDDLSGSVEENKERIFARMLDKQRHPEKYVGISIGYPTFDKLTNGLKPGTVTLIMGKAKGMKSILSINMFKNVVVDKELRAYFHSNEGGYDITFNRFLACASQVPYSEVSTLQFSSPENQDRCFRILQDPAFEKMRARACLDSVSAAHSTTQYISRRIEEFNKMDQEPIKFVVVDYMGLMGTKDPLARSSWEKYGIIAQELKSVAAEHKVAIVTLAHVNRKAMQTESKIGSSVAGGGSEDAGGDNFNFNPEDMSLSSEPLKHVDNICSWRIKNPDSLKMSGIGEGLLTVQMTRDGRPGDVTTIIKADTLSISEINFKLSSI